MRVSVPTIPHVVTAASSKSISAAAAVERIAEFLSPGNVALLTGAGVSVDSGIRAYRGKDGRYMNPNYQPIFLLPAPDHVFVGNVIGETRTVKLGDASVYLVLTRLRSYLGYPPVRDARPNITHCTFAALQYTSHITHLITQNVDGLHKKAIAHLWGDGPIKERILELHGTLHVCPESSELSRQAIDTPTCGPASPLIHVIEQSDRLFLAGTTLATFSAFRLAQYAVKLGKPVLLLNVGPTRVDGLPGVEKIEIPTSHVMRDVVRAVLGTQATIDPVIVDVSNRGIHKPPTG
ncbi:hypothetical protein ID866_3066 [Astraeus odoratus]|nr:hypothetical protein ID866_3066 [Astraeus odoratus]